MRRRLRQPASPTEPINVTPLIDVVMCLIIFFLIVGKLASDQVAGVRLPQTASGRAAQEAAVRVWIGRAEADQGPARIWVMDRPAGAGDDLRRLLREEAEAFWRRERPQLDVRLDLVPIQIRADRDLPFGEVQPVLEACAAMGLASVSLTTERTAPEGRP